MVSSAPSSQAHQVYYNDTTVDMTHGPRLRDTQWRT
jgi:hypothetical protein